MPGKRRDFLLASLPLLAAGCTTTSPQTSARATGKSRSKAEFERTFVASWRHLSDLFNVDDEHRFFAKYDLPPSNIRANSQSPRFYSEFFRLCVNYRLEHGNHLLLEAMRRAQFGRGRWYLPSSIQYIGGKTGTYGQYKHEGLWFNHGGTPYSIVIYTKGHFGRGSNIWKMGALFGGLFREHIA